MANINMSSYVPPSDRERRRHNEIARQIAATEGSKPVKLPQIALRPYTSLSSISPPTDDEAMNTAEVRELAYREYQRIYYQCHCAESVCHKNFRALVPEDHPLYKRCTCISWRCRQILCFDDLERKSPGVARTYRERAFDILEDARAQSEDRSGGECPSDFAKRLRGMRGCEEMKLMELVDAEREADVQWERSESEKWKGIELRTYWFWERWFDGRDDRTRRKWEIRRRRARVLKHERKLRNQEYGGKTTLCSKIWAIFV
ncbi:hypothetical protein PVAG01_08214 [Phlyctema vagabunda]|uniref:Uncharacterized protein n=1 Tax=Phlyctema vagabunda TaxID=108571 RepID=A0ABR4P8T3_9HELO